MKKLSERPQCQNFSERVNEINQKKYQKKLFDYAKNPNRCLSCNSALEYKKRSNKFCSKSCSAKHNNSNRNSTTKNKIISVSCQKCNTNFDQYANTATKICPFCKAEEKNTNIIEHMGERIKLFSWVEFTNCKDCQKPMRKKTHSNTTCPDCALEYRHGYRAAASFDYTELSKTSIFKLDLIQKYGWYGKNNKNGMTYDHLYRVVDGWKNKVDPNILKHPANAEMVSWEENRKRQHQSQITLDELLFRIDNWRD